jgi:hypothetical protein
MDRQIVIETTRRWISSVVIALNLCPFARRVFQTEKIRYVVSDARNETALRQDLGNELKALASATFSDFETTLLIHPCALVNFLDYNDFLGEGERLIEELGLRGTIQIASFHPDYQFAGTDSAAPENYTNRSPYPMLHLLCERSISELAIAPAELLEISGRNIATLRDLGTAKILEKLESIRPV